MAEKNEKQKSPQEAYETIKSSVHGKLDSLWKNIKKTVTEPTQEFMKRGEIMFPFIRAGEEVRKIIALKTYKRKSGDWRIINEKLASFGIKERDIIALQKYLKITPDGKVGPKTIEGLSELFGEKRVVKFGRKTEGEEKLVTQSPKNEASETVQITGPMSKESLESEPSLTQTIAQLAEDRDRPVDAEEEDDTYEKDASAEALLTPTESASEITALTPGQAMAETLRMLSSGHLKSSGMGKSKREAWANAIIRQMQELGMQLTKQRIKIILVTIDRESRFQEMPAVANPEQILDRKIAEFREKHSVIYGAVKDYVGKWRAKAIQFIRDRRKDNLAHDIYRTTTAGERVGYFTEHDIDLAIDYALQQYDNELPSAAKLLVSKEDIEKYRPKTMGCMQTSIGKALELAKKYDGKNYTQRQMRDIMNTREGGLRYGLLYINEIFMAHERDGTIAPEDVKYAFLDFNMGSFSARNAGLQENLNRLGAKLAVDGDLLMYDVSGHVLEKESESEEEIQEILDDSNVEISDEQIRADLLKEKTADFEKTQTYLQLAKLFAAKNLALKKVVPSVKAKGGYVKFGTNKVNAAGYAAGSLKRYVRLS